MKNIIIIGITCDVNALSTAIRIMEDNAVNVIIADEQKIFEERIPYHAPVFELTAHPELKPFFYDEPTNKPKWFQGSETAKFNVPGKKQYCKYNTRKKSRNNKHK